MNERAGMPFLFVAIVGSKAGSSGQNQFGTQLGGAVEKNNLFFSTDYQDHNLNDPTQLDKAARVFRDSMRLTRDARSSLALRHEDNLSYMRSSIALKFNFLAKGTK
jgi:hypothetical protein